MSDVNDDEVGAEPGVEQSDDEISNELVDDRLDDDLEPYRGSPVGTNDPNIVGDVGPFDTPPGRDPDTDLDDLDE